MSCMAETFCQELILPLTISARSLGVTRYSCSIFRLTAEQKPCSILIVCRLAEVGQLGMVKSHTRGKMGKGGASRAAQGIAAQARLQVSTTKETFVWHLFRQKAGQINWMHLCCIQFILEIVKGLTQPLRPAALFLTTHMHADHLAFVRAGLTMANIPLLLTQMEEAAHCQLSCGTATCDQGRQVVRHPIDGFPMRQINKAISFLLNLKKHVALQHAV